MEQPCFTLQLHCLQWLQQASVPLASTKYNLVSSLRMQNSKGCTHHLSIQKHKARSSSDLLLPWTRLCSRWQKLCLTSSYSCRCQFAWPVARMIIKSTISSWHAIYLKPFSINMFQARKRSLCLLMGRTLSNCHNSLGKWLKLTFDLFWQLNFCLSFIGYKRILWGLLNWSLIQSVAWLFLKYIKLHSLRHNFWPSSIHHLKPNWKLTLVCSYFRIMSHSSKNPSN